MSTQTIGFVPHHHTPKPGTIQSGGQTRFLSRQAFVRFGGGPFPGEKAGLKLDTSWDSWRSDCIEELLAFIRRTELADYHTEIPKKTERVWREWYYGRRMEAIEGGTLNELFLVRDKEDKLVGAAGIHQIPDEDEATIHTLYLDPEYRGLGIAQWFMEKLVEDGKKAGLQSLRINAKPVTVYIANAFGFKLDLPHGRAELAESCKSGKPVDLPTSLPMKLDLRG